MQTINSSDLNLFSFYTLISQVRTLFVSGLPMDAKPRELYLLFRAYDGYEGSLLKVTSKNGKTASVRININYTNKFDTVYLKFNVSTFLACGICNIQHKSRC